MEKNIYIVKSSAGQYEDRWDRNERAFRERSTAEAYARKLDWEHLPDPVFSDELWNAVEEEWHEVNFEKYGEDYEIAPFDFNTEREQYDKWQADFDDRHRQFLLEYVNRETGKSYTVDDVLQHERYDDNRYYDWDPCTVEELILEE